MPTTITAAVVPIRTEPAPARLSFGVGCRSICAASIAELVTAEAAFFREKTPTLYDALSESCGPRIAPRATSGSGRACRLPRDAQSSTRGTTLSQHGLAPHLERSLTPTPDWAVGDFLRRIQGALPDGRSLPDPVATAGTEPSCSCSGCTFPRSRSLPSPPATGLNTVSSEGSLVAILAATATLAGRMTRNRHLLSTIVALGLLTSSATIVHLSGGAIEAHFHFFVMMSVLLLYEDWLPYAAAFAYVVLHHGLVGVISPTSVYNHSGAIAHPWRWAMVHGLFVTAAGVANIVNWRLNETARNDALAASSRADLSELRFAVAFDNAPIGVALVAPDGRWLHVNHALLNIIGYTREELLEMDFQTITHPDDLPNDLEHLSRVASGEIDSYALEKRYIHATGRVIWIQLDVSVVRDAAGAPGYAHRPDPGHHQQAPARGAAPPGAEDGGGRPARRRRRARLQQPPHRRSSATASSLRASWRPSGPERARDLDEIQTRRRSAPRRSPASCSRSAASRCCSRACSTSTSRDASIEKHAPAPHRRGRRARRRASVPTCGHVEADPGAARAGHHEPRRERARRDAATAARSRSRRQRSSSTSVAGQRARTTRAGPLRAALP